MTKTYKGVIQHFEAAPERVRDYFPKLVELIERYPWEVSVSYIFSRVEQAKRMTIYCGILKLHWCEKSLTWKLVNEDHLARKRFRDLFRVVFGRKIPDNLISKLEKGEAVRDKIAHGMKWEQKEVREGLTAIIDFAKEFNEFVAAIPEAGFQPFGNLRGFKGRKEPLTKETTRWVLRGMGIPQKSES